jgi:hypothetical protein
MKLNPLFKATAALVAGLLMSHGAAQAALFDRGGGMIYDDTQNVTWVADMNLAYTSGYAAANAGGSGSDAVSADGRMGWGAAMTWADSLNYGGYSDWRLPTLQSNCSGHGCSGELIHLFVADLGNQDQQSVLNQTGDTATQIANLAMFQNVGTTGYWSSTPRPPYEQAWFYWSLRGIEAANGINAGLNAIAVRDGDVSAVPEPETYALMLAGLGVLGAVARRRKMAPHVAAA